MKKIIIQTSKDKQVLDITDLINDELQKQNFKDGMVNIFLTHTTAALTTADLDPGTDLDLLDAYENMVPKLEYRHPHDPSHVKDHILSTLIGTSIIIPVSDGKLVLGAWQRVVLVEFDGPRERQLVLSFSK